MGRNKHFSCIAIDSGLKQHLVRFCNENKEKISTFVEKLVENAIYDDGSVNMKGTNMKCKYCSEDIVFVSGYKKPFNKKDGKMHACTICPTCGNRILWLKESKRPYNLDLTMHICDELESRCVYCGKQIIWNNKEGKERPFNKNGTIHTCDEYYNGELKGQIDIDAITEEIKNPYECENCGDRFNDEHLGSKFKNEDTGRWEYYCDECVIDDVEVECDKCGKKLENGEYAPLDDGIEVQVKIDGGNNTWFYCNDCRDDGK